MSFDLPDIEDPVDDPVDALMVECLEHPLEARAAALSALCAKHPEHAGPLQARYRFLVEAGLIDDAAAAKFTMPERLGEFRLLRLLGHGGMGVVYLAEDERSGREVALKLIQPGAGACARARARFRREAETVSQLDHPNICRVFEAGEIEGVPYLAMRYVEGETLAQRIALQTARSRGDVPPADSPGAVEVVVALGEQLARALHAVHEAGVVHRDVKPGNVLLERATGEPLLLDFGLAQLDDDEHPTLTLSGDRVGTPAYMAPEQVAGRSVDRRTDVYALGATLYEALTGRAVHRAPTREALYRRILEGEISHASRHNPHVRRDLAVVLATALERDPDRRYRTAAEFADDLGRVRGRLPVAARTPGIGLRARRWCRRNPYAASAIGVLVTGLAVTAILLDTLIGTLAERDAALNVREVFERLATDPVGALELARKTVALDPTPAARGALRAAAHAPRVEHEFALTHKADVSFTCRVGGSPLDDVLAWCDRPGMELRIWRRGAFAAPAVLGGDRDLEKFCVRISPEGERVAVAGWDAPVTVHDLDGGLLYELPIPAGAEAALSRISVAWHPAGDRLAVGIGDDSIDAPDARFEVQMWSLDPGGPVRLWATPVGAWPMHLRFVDEDTLVAAPGAIRSSSRASFRDHDVRAFRTSDGTVWRSHHWHTQPCMEMAVHGSLVATAGHDGRLVLWDLETGETVVRQHPARIYTVDVSRDGQRIATACADGVVRQFDPFGGEPTAPWAPHGTTPVKSAVFTPDGDALLVNHVQGRELRTLDGRLLTRLPKGNASVRNDWFLASDRLATVDRYAVRIWRLRSSDLDVVVHPAGQLPVYSPNGTRHVPGGSDGANRPCVDDEGRVYRVSADRRILVHDADGRLEYESEPWRRPIWLLGVAPSDGLLAASGNGRNVRVVRRRGDGSWEDVADQGLPSLPGRLRIGHSPFRWLAGEDGSWRIVVGTWRGIVDYEFRPDPAELRYVGAVLEDEVVQGIAVAPGGRRIAANLESHGICLLARDGASWSEGPWDRELRADHIAFAGADRLLLTTRDEVRILDLELRHVDTLPNLDDVGLVSARAVPGGQKIATLAANGIEREWWLEGGRVEAEVVFGRRD